MSQTTPSKVLKLSPNSSKQGPMKATIPMTSVLKQPSNPRNSNSPTLSPTSSSKPSLSPEHYVQRSPGSKGKSRSLGSVDDNGKHVLKRTASLDTIYLKGQWPRDHHYCMHGYLQIDKATQTDDSDWMEARKLHFLGEPDEKFDKLVKPRIQRSNNQQSPSGRVQLSPSSTPLIGDHTLNTSCQTMPCCRLPRAMPVNIPMKPLSKPTMRNSVEGLNQEIEKLVQRANLLGPNNYEQREEMDKEGHRAPLPDLFRRSRSVNTQTPTSLDYGGSRYSSSPPSRESISPLISRQLDTSPSETGGSRSSTPDDNGRIATSPHIFAVRGPPDGCERVRLKSVDDKRSLPFDTTPVPCRFQLKPSQGSAFKLLQRNLQPSKQDLPLVPSEQDLI